MTVMAYVVHHSKRHSTPSPAHRSLPHPTSPLGWKSRDSVPKLVEQYLSGDLKVDEFLTTTMPIESVNTAFDLMRKGKA